MCLRVRRDRDAGCTQIALYFQGSNASCTLSHARSTAASTQNIFRISFSAVTESELIDNARKWLSDDIDEDDRRELQALIDRGAIDDLRERFRGPLEFGTAGLRGVLGAGESRMNRAVVVRTTAGLAQYLLKSDPRAAERGVVLGRDARRGSSAFLDDAAEVLAGYGIRAHVFDGIVPTPLVSYAVRALNAAAGVMITASHNPPEYNGYKVYAGNSAQIIPPMDVGIAAEIAKISSAREVPREGGQRETIGQALVDGYFDEVVRASRRSAGRNQIKIVYTPMHGVGDTFAHEVFRRMGLHAISVPQQAQPDGRFPTVKFPNPEEPGALDLSLALARSENADVVIANDPDADRLAIAAPDGKGGFVALNGNELGILLGHYLLADDPHPSRDRIAITTIVSSPLLGLMCKKLGVRYAETLTGFKWITNKAMEIEAATGARFVFGYEEALGYTVDALVRDKDGISAAARIGELVGTLKARGETILGRLEKIYREFGLVVSKQHNITRPGSEGAAAIKREMAAMRAKPPTTIGGERVESVRDYSKGDDLPPSDVLAFTLHGGTRITMRPSGTEPKIKYYFDVVEPLTADEPFEEGKARAQRRLETLMKAFVELTAKL
jgi:phosphomannomutase